MARYDTIIGVSRRNRVQQALRASAEKAAITFTFVGLETITGIVLAILLLFLNVEKNIAKEQEEIKQRNGETTE